MKTLLNCHSCEVVITQENHVQTTLPSGEIILHPVCMHCWPTWKEKPLQFTTEARLSIVEAAVQKQGILLEEIATYIRNSLKGEGQGN